MTAEAYRSLRSQTEVAEVSFGYTTVTLHSADQLDEAQLGYGGDDWAESWLVIGYDDLVGDPLFVDLAVTGFPVYTAAHGEGSWEPQQVADSFVSFVRVLELVASIAQGRESPTALERNPFPDEKRARVLDEIAKANPSSSLEFWATWLEG